MTAGTDDAPATSLPPDEAFGVLGNETRIRILVALGDADEPLSFSELRSRVDLRHSGQFNYHLDKLVGHFVEKTAAGYVLRQPGRRIVEAIVAGIVTADPEMHGTQLDLACAFCETPIEMSFGQERVELYCPGCPGFYRESEKSRESIDRAGRGIIGGFRFPPTGVQGRTPAEVLRAASIWGTLELISLAMGVCPRCAGAAEHAVRVCEDHDAGDDLCDGCDRRHAVQIRSDCTVCLYSVDSFFLNHLIATPELRAFVAEHGIHPLASVLRWGWDYEEDIRSLEPFEARFTFTIEDDSITLTVDESLSVVDVTQ